MLVEVTTARLLSRSWITTLHEEKIFGVQEILTEHLLILPFCIIKVSGKLQQPTQIIGPEPSGIKVWVTLPGKEALSGMLVEHHGNTEGLIQGDSCEYQL